MLADRGMYARVPRDVIASNRIRKAALLSTLSGRAGASFKILGNPCKNQKTPFTADRPGAILMGLTGRSPAVTGSFFWYLYQGAVYV